MGRKKQKSLAEKEIKILFARARKLSKKDPESARNLIRKARRKAMHYNIKLGRNTREKFCRKCLSYFTAENTSLRFKKGFIVVKCLKCNALSRYKI